jgi:transposase
MPIPKRLEDGKFRWPRIEDGWIGRASTRGAWWRRKLCSSCGKLNQAQFWVWQIAPAVLGWARGPTG